MTAERGSGGFFAELKRRNVFRVGIAYLVTAWLLLQVADIVLENIKAPDWIIQVFMLALGLGLPLALIFAWAFELTPEGLKKEKDVDRSQSITRQTGRKLDFIIIGVLAAVIVVLLADRFVGSGPRRADATDAEQVAGDGQVAPAAPPRVSTAAEDGGPPSIAVLPFVNMSSDPEQEFFSDGISEEILNSLAQVKELKVAGRTSSFAFKGQNQDLRQVGQALGVDHILEGSVRKAGATVRITAQLVQVEDGFHLWSDTYDRELTNVFEIQDEIASAILEQLKTHLVGLETAAAPQAAQRTDPDVYEKYLLAKQRLYERKRLSIEAAVKLLDAAIAQDPEYAPAYAQRGIAALLLSDRNYGSLTLAEAGAQGRLYLDKALQLDPELAEAWAGIGLYHVNRPTEQREGMKALEKALSINPNLIDASNWLQIAYGETGDNQNALKILEDMVARDPLYPPGLTNAINAYNLFGRQDESWALIERVRPFLPGDPVLLQVEATTWMSLGEPAKALPLLEKALETQPSDAVIRNFFGWSLIATGQLDRAAEEGHRWHKALVLSFLGKREEAVMIAEGLAAEGSVDVLLNILHRTGQHERLVQWFESRWPDLGAFEREYPHAGDGYRSMLSLANAYSVIGNAARFDDAMARVRAAHDQSIAQGVQDANFFAEEARYYVLAGDLGQAMAQLGKAVDLGLQAPVPLAALWPEFKALSGDPQFEAIKVRARERLDAQRAALGLEPLSA